MTNIEQIAASLDTLAMLPMDEHNMEQVIALMEQGVALPKGLDTLVKRYAERTEPLLLRPLTFFIARTISREGLKASADNTMRLLEHLQCDDETVCTNVASALHLLAMYCALPEQAPPQLIPFLEASLHNGLSLRDAVVPAAAMIITAGVRFTDGDQVRLRTALEGVQIEYPDWVNPAIKALG